MSLRFQTRMAADFVSEWLASATRGAPVAQLKHAPTTTIIGNAVDVALGTAVAASYDNDVARKALGAAYLLRGGIACGGALLAGLTGLTLSGSSRGDRDRNSFNRSHRLATAAINLTIGTALLTGIAGREAALAGSAKGVAEFALGSLAETLTRPTRASVPELLSVIEAPASPRAARVAHGDLIRLGAEALPALCAAYAKANKRDADLFGGIVSDMVYWSRETRQLMAIVVEHVIADVAREGSDVDRNIRLLNRLCDVTHFTLDGGIVRDALRDAQVRLEALEAGTPPGSDVRKLRAAIASRTHRSEVAETGQRPTSDATRAA